MDSGHSAGLQSAGMDPGRAEARKIPGSSPSLYTAILYCMIVPASVIMLTPLIWMFLTSLKSYEELFIVPPIWIPEEFRWGNYTEALTVYNFTGYLLNSAVVAILAVSGTLVSSAMAAYGFSCLRIRGSQILFGLLLCSLMLPAQITIIPLFQLYSRLGWINTLYPLFIPAWLGLNVFAIFLLRQFFLTIPVDYVDAARLDGASEFRILLNVFVPLSKPALLTISVFAFIGSWNDLWNPVIFLHDESLYTMPVGLLNFIALAARPQGSPWHLVMAVSTLMVIPIIILFFFAQRQFIEGISITGVKA